MQRSMMQPQKLITRSTVFALLLAGCALLLLRASPAALAASPPTCSPQAFAVYPSANPSTTDFNSLSTIAASASNDIWAVGSYSDVPPPAGQTLVEHYTGSAWSVVASPNPGDVNGLDGISLLSSTNIWAVGIQETASAPITSLVEHWDGSSWSVIPSANDPNIGDSTFLNAVSAISASDVWAVGYSQSASVVGSNAPFIEHWDGSSWSAVPGADLGSLNGELAGVAATSSTDVWAVGYEYDLQAGIDTPLVEHWDGSAWSVVSTSSIDSGSLSAVTALSSSDVWAVGEFAGPPQTLIEHWDGSAWSVVSSPNVSADQLLGIAADSTTDIWAVGLYSGAGGTLTLVLHWNGTAWSIVPSANPSPEAQLEGVVALSPTQVWAVGSTSLRATVGETVVEHAIKNPIRLMCPR